MHALREEGDPSTIGRCRTWCNFNPRPPRGGRHHILYFRYCSFYFNPRPPRGGRREYFSLSFRVSMNFNPRPPRGGRRLATANLGAQSISIHALREEGDASQSSRGCHVHHFNPRPPRGGRLYKRVKLAGALGISIHALREEGDGRNIYFLSAGTISIHALREEGD